MKTMPGSIAELDGQARADRGEELHFCCDRQSNSYCPVFRIGEAGEKIRKIMKGLGHDI